MKKIFKISFLMSLLFLGMTNISALERTCVKCGNAIEIPALLPVFVSRLILLIQIVIPIILIVTGLIRYTKAVMSGDDKVIKETNSSFIRSIIAAVLVFIVISIVKTAFTLFDQADTEGSGATNSCVSCFITGDCNKTVCTARDGSKDSHKKDDNGNIIPFKGCSDYSITSEGCPAVAEDGLPCKTVKTENSSVPYCMKACSVLSMSECQKRDDCQVNGPSSCKDKK